MTFIALDDDSMADDRGLGSHVPLLLEQSTRDTYATHHEGGAIAWRAESSTGNYAAFSTHPDYYYAIPFVVPVYPGAQALKVDLLADFAHGDGAGNAMRVRLTCGTVTSAATTVTVGTNTSVALDVDVDPDSYGYARCAVLVQSVSGFEREESAVDGLLLTAYFADGIYSASSSLSGIGNGRAHYHLRADAETLTESGEFYRDFHLTRTDTTNDYVWTWPVSAEGVILRDPRTVQNSNADLYHLGTIAPKSLAWRFEGSDTLDDFGPSYSAAQSVRAAYAMNLMQGRCASHLRNRRRAFAVLPSQDDAPELLGVQTTSSGGVVGGALVTCDESRFGVDVVMMALPRYPDETGDEYTITVTQFGADGSSLQVDTFSWDFEPSQSADSVHYPFPSRYVRDGGSLARWNAAARNPTEHGHGDLMLASEIQQGIIGGVLDAVGFRRLTVEWDSTLSTGDTVRVQVEVDDRVHVWTCLIAETP